MLGILLTILKIIAIVLLAIVGIVLLFVLWILFAPVKYECHGIFEPDTEENSKNQQVQAKVTWLWRAISIPVSWDPEQGLQYKLKVFGFEPGKIKRKKKKQSARKEKSIGKNENKLSEDSGQIEDTKPEKIPEWESEHKLHITEVSADRQTEIGNEDSEQLLETKEKATPDTDSLNENKNILEKIRQSDPLWQH